MTTESGETAVYGGAFDPVHREHVAVAEACVRELNAGRLILVPACNPPHKHVAEASFSDRAEMLRIAFAGFPAETIVSDVENVSPGVNCSYMVLPRLREIYGDFVFIMGGDSLKNFETWREPEFIARNFRIAVFNREGYPDASAKAAELNARWNARIRVMRYRGGAEDSSELRLRLALGTYREGLPPGVREYAEERRLYHSLDVYLEGLSARLSPERLLHCKNSAVAACLINERCGLGLDPRKTIVSALLHDAGKKDVGAPDGEGVPEDCSNPLVRHQFAGAVTAERDFGITDPDMLNAVRYHTTGRPGMSTLEKVVYVADLIEEGRDYPGVDGLRKAVYEDFESGFRRCLRECWESLVRRGEDIYPLTVEAKKYYEENI